MVLPSNQTIPATVKSIALSELTDDEGFVDTPRARNIISSFPLSKLRCEIHLRGRSEIIKQSDGILDIAHEGTVAIVESLSCFLAVNIL